MTSRGQFLLPGCSWGRVGSGPLLYGRQADGGRGQRSSAPGPEQFVHFSFRSVHFVRMKLHFSSIPYSPTIGHGDRSVRLVEFDQKVIELFRPCSALWETGGPSLGTNPRPRQTKREAPPLGASSRKFLGRDRPPAPPPPLRRSRLGRAICGGSAPPALPTPRHICVSNNTKLITPRVERGAARGRWRR